MILLASVSKAELMGWVGLSPHYFDNPLTAPCLSNLWGGAEPSFACLIFGTQGADIMSVILLMYTIFEVDL